MGAGTEADEAKLLWTCEVWRFGVVAHALAAYVLALLHYFHGFDRPHLDEAGPCLILLGSTIYAFLHGRVPYLGLSEGVPCTATVAPPLAVFLTDNEVPLVCCHDPGLTRSDPDRKIGHFKGFQMSKSGL
ncbi:hypothetical protein BJY52DRAFT_1225519 [Lactarius psammicola]|nr:hypothetical protein BJY52DRAFT_1225519 [Lactarius psammicola]